MANELPKTYDPHTVEAAAAQRFREQEYGNPDTHPRRHRGPFDSAQGKPFVVMMALPNVTGSLHLGHALEASLIDCLVRWKRMRGFETLYLPGMDHAGIATQNVVEKLLKKEGKTRFELGREKFLERVWQWKEESGGIILEQFRRLGISVDWSRERFTLDKAYAKAVEAAFRHYEKRGWIYKGERVVNWCTRCATSLSDLELEYHEEESKLWYIRYPLTENSKSETRNPKQIQSPKSKVQNDAIVVATTRPETMLGDTAVAGHRGDARYQTLVGGTVRL